ncbi:MAG: murein biosynthesis integral membrane protein MurJ [Rhodobacter sp.]|nr:murein biosynthesis integral membrane protein MurJ [Rhodobacter sp.]MCA3514471.1 murein biosynthesis integral membrane protein MurJ [Rhodobacter sp.]MCA3521027.1 murein biosynthesis integral membrane protein MurJ [Rhodobacter sp.]MCA3523923.1 murein biosynthesis integral membrane protein MurJ [Rhodobacter sp.]MCA3526271.1 murein biosynthesis integral membrane protein MurJ [Rhodobacter sp.]
MQPIRLLRGFLTVGSWTLVSRLVGFLRDVMMAAYLGAGPVAEAFLIAFSLPNMFRRFFAEGAFNMAFVPMFSKKLESGEDAQGFARDAFNALAGVLILFTIIGTLAMPALVWAMASGFVGDARFDLAVLFGRIAFSYILFISLVAMLSGVLNAFGRFTEASFVPVLMNLMFIAAMLLAERAGWDMGLTLAWTVPVTGIAQLGFTWISAHRAGLRFTPGWPRITPDLKRLAIIAGPAVLAGGVVQVNLLVGRQVASFTEGAVAWLSYADRLYQLPLGVVGIAIGTVLLPDLSRRLRAGDLQGGRDSLNRGAEFALALTLPAAVALVVIALPLTTVLFQRGAFGADDAANTALALAAYGIGLPAFVLHKVLQPLFYAREDTRRPFRYAVMSMLVNAGFAVGFMPLMGFMSAALATTVAGWVMVWQLWAGSRAMGEAAQTDARLRRRLPRLVAASALMGCCLWAGAILLGPALGTPGLRYVALGGLVATGIVSYFGFGTLLGAFRLADFRAALRRQR